MTGKNILKGMVAGFIATIVLSALMIMKTMMGLMPELNVIAMLTKMMGATSPVAGWVAHFVIGTLLWGGLFAWLDPNIPVPGHWLKGIIFGISAWLLMMIIVMPMAGVGFFGVGLGMMAPIMTLILHIIFGVVLGWVYGLERPEPAEQLRSSHRL